MIVLQIIFWYCFFALAHTYIFYPLLLKILVRKEKNVSPNSNFQPAISILIPAYNEEKIIKQKIESILSSDYPKQKIEIIVGSDASTDRTGEIVKSLTGVKLIEFSGRSGKPKIINHLVTLAKNEVLILTDANIIFDKATIRELAKHFSDEKIALVDSNMMVGNTVGGIAKAESTYIKGEVGIKHNEGKVFGMMMGPFGGCYAIRKRYYSPVPENFLVDDFFINMKVLEKGGKAISELNAIVYEEVPSDWLVEFKRKTRIATGSWQNLFAFAPLIFRFNSLSFCFVSHKVLRWKGAFNLIVLYFLTLYFAFFNYQKFEFGEFVSIYSYPPGTNFYYALFIIENFLILLVAFDLILASLKILSPTRLITHFFTTNLTLIIGFFKFLRGIKSGIWQPTIRP